MNIGTAATRSGVAPKMIRHYERIGLIPAAVRRPNGYRAYCEADIHTLCFVRRARDLGFSMEEVRDLLDLWRDRARSTVAVKTLAEKYLDVLDQKRQELEFLRRALADLITDRGGEQEVVLDSKSTGRR